MTLLGTLLAQRVGSIVAGFVVEAPNEDNSDKVEQFIHHLKYFFKLLVSVMWISCIESLPVPMSDHNPCLPCGFLMIDKF